MLETARLYLRFFEQNDFEDIFRLQRDAETMRYIRAPEPDPVVVQTRMDTWEKYHAENPALGVFTILRRENRQFVGYAVLRHAEFTPGKEIEVGYTLAPEMWGKGMATEVTKALLQYGFEQLEVPEIVAFTDPQNAASQHVLAKCGFQYVDKRTAYGGESNFFVLNRAAYHT